MTKSIYHNLVISPENKPTVQGPTMKTPASQQMYRGFSTINKSSKNFTLYDFELIKQDLLNSFYVRQGERLMNAPYGCIIWALIFEPLTTEIQQLIQQNVNVILNSDPRVQAGNILITPYDTGLEISCTLTYLPYNISTDMKLKFDQQNGLLAQ
jgi:phage baseplate assembly protein W